jgi:pseudaminic acid biosynthesis-associated methylase
MQASGVATVEFWKQDFGDSYTRRNALTDDLLQARVRLWEDIFGHITDDPQAILEVGANIGTNLRALRDLTAARFYAVEPNEKARFELRHTGLVYPLWARGDTADKIGFRTDIADLVFTSGVLIHIHPDDLLASCKEIHRCARQYIVAIEYFSAVPREVEYRGHSGKLWTRDFGQFYLDHFPDLKAVEAGFAWKATTGLDDLTWVLLEKK